VSLADRIYLLNAASRNRNPISTPIKSRPLLQRSVWHQLR